MRRDFLTSGSTAGLKHRSPTHARTIWLTGLSGAGKSTLALALQTWFQQQGQACCVLDGDQLREGLNRDLGFSAQDRCENVWRVAEVARLMNGAGLTVVTALISPYQLDRAQARGIVGPAQFIEVYLNTSVAVCEQRDPKGLYKRARAGLIKGFTGIDAPFEVPLSPEVILDTSQRSLSECVSQVLSVCESRPVDLI